MAKFRFLGRSCLEFISENDHFIIDPMFFEPPEQGITDIFLTHEHEDHANPDKINQILQNYGPNGGNITIHGPKTTLDELDDIQADFDEIVPGEMVRMDDFEIRVFSVDCYKAKECLAYLIFYNGVRCLHTADSANFSKTLYFLTVEIDHCFVACFEDYFNDYVSFAKAVNVKKVHPYHFNPEETQKGRDLVSTMEINDIRAEFLDIGAEVEL